jgi:hypothetical protein
LAVLKLFVDEKANLFSWFGRDSKLRAIRSLSKIISAFGFTYLSERDNLLFDCGNINSEYTNEMKSVVLKMNLMCCVDDFKL